MERKRGARLTDTFVKKIAQPGRYGDGRGGLGLSLLVKRTQNGRWSKCWCQRIRIDGKLTELGLGSYPVVTMAMAKQKAMENAQRVKKGEDILTNRPRFSGQRPAADPQ